MLRIWLPADAALLSGAWNNTNPNSETRKKSPQGPRPRAVRFLLRHLNRRCLRRFSSSFAAPSASASATPIFSSSRRISPEIVHSSYTAVVAASVIDTLPLFTFSSVTRRSSSAAVDCAVCLSKFRHQIWGW
ncbi:E3 ubiquitin-protein [Vigna angularis]|uniref:E3 ubiquitin-protein n=1 Tax=Phaseolus angularis TaxID=3914 RepID=A0A8T0KIR2_PHAAN|nr:E3 ubiquitin-protein [Vigna angularis]